MEERRVSFIRSFSTRDRDIRQKMDPSGIRFLMRKIIIFDGKITIFDEKNHNSEGCEMIFRCRVECDSGSEDRLHKGRNIDCIREELGLEGNA
jgi:hypothetical protein